MTLRPAIAALFFVASVPLCAGVAAGVVYLGDRLLGDSVPYTCGKRGLVVGLMGLWGTVLFGFLMGQVDRIATWIAPLPGPDGPPQGIDPHVADDQRLAPSPTREPLVHSPAWPRGGPTECGGRVTRRNSN